MRRKLGGPKRLKDSGRGQNCQREEGSGVWMETQKGLERRRRKKEKEEPGVGRRSAQKARFA